MKTNGSKVAHPDVFFVPERSRGTARIRSWWPAAALREAGIDARCAVEEDETRSAVDIPNMIRNVRPKVVVIHQTATWYKAELVREFRRHGAHVITSEDDAFWLWPHGGKTREAIDAANDHTRRQMGLDLETVTRTAAFESDRIVVTTAHLARLFGRWNQNVTVIPNRLPAWVSDVEPVAVPEDRRPFVGFRGTVGAHLRDLEWLRPVARELFAGATLLEVGGGGEVGEFLGLPRSRVLAWSFTHDARELYSRMATADVGIVPLDPGLEWNAAKSWLGGLEWATLGVPVIASATEDMMKLWKEGIPVGTTDDPYVLLDEAIVETLTDDPPEDYKGAAAKASLDNHVSEWIDLVRPYR